MNKLSFLGPTFFLFFHFLFFQIVIAEPHTPKELILLNCGSSETTTSPDDRLWIGDLNSKFKAQEPSQNHSLTAKATSQSTSVPSVPYMTARLSRFSYTYSLPVSPGPKYLRLYFYPASYPGFDRSKDFFDVKAGTYTLLRNFSASLYADGWEVEAFLKEFYINVKENQQLNITFAPFLGNSNESYAFINGIEIVSMPTYLYYTPPDDLGRGVPLIGQKTKLYLHTDTAMEKMCRVNVGGSTIAPTNDTGMYRLWGDDYIYSDYQTLVDSKETVSLIYSRIPAYTAPDEVYWSSRGLAADSDTHNLTWKVPVDQGFSYLVRLHFCEYVDMVEANQRRFDIFIDNQKAEVGFDVIESSGGHNIPIYKDYIVAAGKKGVTVDYILLIVLRPNYITSDAFLNGLEVFKLSDSDGNLAGPNPNPTVSPAPAISPVQPVLPSNNSNSKKTPIIAVVGGVLGLLIILCLIVFMAIWRMRKMKHYGSYYKTLSCCWRMDSLKGQSSRTKASLPEELCRHFSLAEIKAATDNFHESLIIGEGGFGYVYKGDIDGGATTVAIKRLNPESKQGAREFKTEIEMLSQLRHVHLVSLIGYCHEDGEMLLVYEYLTNGTLRNHLYDTDNDPLPWKKRLEICVGAARGLHYLHNGVKHTIIHRDVKTTNILLDENWMAKVSDFGLSKIGVSNTAVSTMVKGTIGYLDPEYARRQQLTEKSDVFSFGVVLFEVLCSRKPINHKLDKEQWSLVIWVRKCIQNGTIHQIIDPYLMGKISHDCFNKFVEISERCIRDNGSERPSMNDVMENLGFALELQKAADAGKADGDYVYPEASFQAPKYTNNRLFGRSELGSDAGGFSTLEDLTATTGSGISYPSIESESKTSHVFTDSTNSATK